MSVVSTPHQSDTGYWSSWPECPRQTTPFNYCPKSVCRTNTTTQTHTHIPFYSQTLNIYSDSVSKSTYRTFGNTFEWQLWSESMVARFDDVIFEFTRRWPMININLMRRRAKLAGDRFRLMLFWSGLMDWKWVQDYCIMYDWMSGSDLNVGCVHWIMEI